MVDKISVSEYEVVKDHKSENDDPIVLVTGDIVKLGEKSDDNGEWPNWIYCTSNRTFKEGWTPIQILKIQGDMAIAVDDYDATEMTVTKGDIVIESKALNGWKWCERKSDGATGWVPEGNLYKFK